MVALSKMAEILGLLAVGFIVHKLKILPEQTPKVLSGLIAKLFMPCLVMNAMINNCTPANLAENTPLVLYGGALALISLVCSYPLAALFGGKDRVLKRQYRYSFAVPNSGATGLPLAIALGGSLMLFQINLFNLVLSFVTYTWGLMQLIPEGKGGIRSALRRLLNPILIGLAVGMALGLTGGNEWIPGAFRGVVETLGNCYVVTAVLLVGYSVAEIDLRVILGDIRTYLFAALRLLVIPLVFLGALRLTKAPAVAASLAVLTYGGPCGMNPIIFATEYGVDEKKMAALLLVTMPLSVVTMPLLYALAVSLWGG